MVILGCPSKHFRNPFRFSVSDYELSILGLCEWFLRFRQQRELIINIQRVLMVCQEPGYAFICITLFIPLGQELVNFFYKWPDGKLFSTLWPAISLSYYSALKAKTSTNGFGQVPVKLYKNRLQVEFGPQAIIGWPLLYGIDEVGTGYIFTEQTKRQKHKEAKRLARGLRY